MIRQLSIENYKSVANATIPISQFTVLIGENGAGKSNVLEALVLASAASKPSLERELLIARGVRMTSSQLMRSAFNSATKKKPIKIKVICSSLVATEHAFDFSLTHDDSPYSDWKLISPKEDSKDEYFKKIPASLSDSKNDALEKFTVYSPDYYTLRNFLNEGHTTPLGTRGEGLLNLLKRMKEKNPTHLKEINDGLKILGWYKGIDSSSLTSPTSENRLLVKDKYIRGRGITLDQVSTNEGFLFCLFYLTLFASPDTPRAFAVENIENGLNPKLVESLITKLKEFSKKYGKQVLISTHSPSVLDALNLDGAEDLLLAVDRNLEGRTRISQVKKPINGVNPTRLSSLFLKGLIGGVPQNFI